MGGREPVTKKQIRAGKGIGGVREQRDLEKEGTRGDEAVEWRGEDEE